MLDAYKKLYEKVADEIPGWRKLDKNTLINKYVENENNPTLKESYIAAIMCKYWGAISKYYQSSHSSGVTAEDCHDWLTHAVMYALAHKNWLKQYSTKKRVYLDVVVKDPISGEERIEKQMKWIQDNSMINSSYSDPKGPDKCMNMCIASTRSIFYDASNHMKRSINYQKPISIDSLYEKSDKNKDAGKSAIIKNMIDNIERDVSDINYKSSPAYNLIKNAISKKNYTEALILDSIVNSDVFVKNADKKSSFSKVKLSKNLRSIDEKYCQLFSKMYDIDYKTVIEAVNNMKSYNSAQLNRSIKKLFSYFQDNQKELEEELCIN